MGRQRPRPGTHFWCHRASPISGSPAWPLLTVNMMKNFKRRFSLSVPRTETIEESLAEFTEQFNQLHNRRNEGEGHRWPGGRGGPRWGQGEGGGSDTWPSQTCSSGLSAEIPSRGPAPSPRQTVARGPGSRPPACSTGGRTSAASPWR